MNIEYTHVNNRAIIKDENGKSKIVPYYDKLYETLLNENCIEELEKQLNTTIEDKEKLKKHLKYLALSIKVCKLSIISI